MHVLGTGSRAFDNDIGVFFENISAADLQVTDDDAVTIYSANQKGSFMAAAKVAFVLK